MLTTGRSNIPYLWIVMITIPFAAAQFISGIFGACFIFSLKKFIDDPATIAFLMSIPPLFNLVLKAWVAFISDRAWTPWGRRKPFLLATKSVHICTLAALPLAPDLETFLAIWMLQALTGVGNVAWEPLKLEVVPPPQRGASSALAQAIANFKNIIFYVVIFARYDDVRFMGEFSLTGETTLFWLASALTLLTLTMVALGIRERRRAGTQAPARIGVVAAARAILAPDLRRVYVLIIGHALLAAGLGFMSTLLYTEQWGYSKQEMGGNIAIGASINIVLALVVGRLADRGDRMRLYRFGIAGALVMEVLYLVYVLGVLPDQRPSLAEMVLFGEIMAVFGLISATVYYPLVYDYVERDRMGTYAAGAGIVNDLTHVVALNGVGVFVQVASLLIMPPSGAMTRVCLAQDTSRSAVEHRLAAHTWQDADGRPVAADRLDARPWYANGAILDTGRAFEIRLRDDQARDLATRRDELTSSRVAALRTGGDAAAVVERELASATAALALRSAVLRPQVLAALDGILARDGDQVLGLDRRTLLVAVLAIITEADRDHIEALLAAWRRADPAAVDLRLRRSEGGHGVVLAFGREDDGSTVETVAATLARLATVHAPDLLPTHPVVLKASTASAIRLDLATVEPPADPPGSPVTRLFNGLLALVGHPIDPQRRLHALARSLCHRPGESATPIAMARVAPLDDTRGIRITALGAAADGRLDDDLGQRLSSLAAGDLGLALAARRLHDRTTAKAAGLRLTVVQPLLADGYAPMRWNYFLGYLWLLFIGAIGLGVTLWFSRLERRGLVRKLGRLEHGS